MVFRLLVLSSVALVAACAGEDGEADWALPRVGAPPGLVAVRLPEIAPSPATSPVGDPKLPGFDGWALVFDARHHRGADMACSVTLARDGAVLRTLGGDSTAEACVAIWDGRDAGGAWVAPGPVDARAAIVRVGGAELAAAELSLEVARLGIDRIELQSISPGDREPLLYRALGGVREGFHEMPADEVSWRLGPDASEPVEAVSLELADGTPRELPPPWDDLASPPLDPASSDGVERDSHNLPTAWIAGAPVEVRARLSADVAGAPGGGEPAMAEVRLVPPAGTEAMGGTSFAHGSIVDLRTTASPAPAVGRYDWMLEWSFEARRPGGEWVPVPGTLTTVHRVYGLVAAPIFDYEGVPHRAWVDVVDAVAGWVDGSSAEADEVAARIVEGVYWELGLQYDRERGASSYTDYPGAWEGAVFDLSAFQERDNGDTVNCSDAASIVSAYANMLGVDLRYHILTHESDPGFDLNYIQAIGWEGFTETPFTSGRGAFRYHAVVGPADGRFFDATLALDGDGTPTSLPSSLLLAQGLPPADYLRALSSEWMEVRTRVDEKVRVR